MRDYNVKCKKQFTHLKRNDHTCSVHCTVKEAETQLFLEKAVWPHFAYTLPIFVSKASYGHCPAQA